MGPQGELFRDLRQSHFHPSQMVKRGVVIAMMPMRHPFSPSRITRNFSTSFLNATLALHLQLNSPMSSLLFTRIMRRKFRLPTCRSLTRGFPRDGSFRPSTYSIHSEIKISSMGRVKDLFLSIS